jgi:hypothetical protein
LFWFEIVYDKKWFVFVFVPSQCVFFML